jgi:membrane-bound lytic murein transglycosylase B
MTIKIPPFRSKLIPFLLFFLICLTLPGSLFCEETGKGNEFEKLIQKLVDDGFDREKTEQIFSSKEISFTPETVSLFFIHSESSLDYDQFTSPKSIESALKYLADNKEILDKAEETYGVDKTVITAILLVETRLGSYLGNRTVINTLSTMAALSDETLRERVWNSIPDEKKPVREAFIKKAQDKTNWGYNELKALLQYTEKEGVAPESIKGSYAGALGVSQFMPSNALKLAKDGDNDGKIDLFNHADAIFSVANYLKHHGWQSGITRQRQHEILFRYNHSNYYVDTLLKISDKLKG